jgi:hypothetical protein
MQVLQKDARTFPDQQPRHVALHPDSFLITGHEIFIARPRQYFYAATGAVSQLPIGSFVNYNRIRIVKLAGKLF